MAMDTNLINKVRKEREKFRVDEWHEIYSNAKKTKNVDEMYSFMSGIDQVIKQNINILPPTKLARYIKSQNNTNKLLILQKILSKDKEKNAKKLNLIENTLIDEQTFRKLYTLEYSNQFLAKMVRLMERIKKIEEKELKKENIIVLKDVVKFYYNSKISFLVLDKANLTIKKGDFVIILGPSGSGKTTLLNIMSGLDNATSGQVIVCNQNLINKNASQLTRFRRKYVSFIFQQYGLLPNLTVRENVEIGADLQINKRLRLDIDTVLKNVGMFEYRKKMPFELSGGQQQRVSIARTLVKNPDIIFGDEPTGALDEETSKKIMEMFVDVNKKYQTTIVLVTHNEELTKYANKVIRVVNRKIQLTSKKAQ